MMCNVVVVGGGGDAPRPHWPAWEGCVLCYVSVVVSPAGWWWWWLTTTGCVSGWSLLVLRTADNSTLNPPSFRDSRHIQPVSAAAEQLSACTAARRRRRKIKTLESRSLLTTPSTHRHSAASRPFFVQTPLGGLATQLRRRRQRRRKCRRSSGDNLD